MKKIFKWCAYAFLAMFVINLTFGLIYECSLTDKEKQQMKIEKEKKDSIYKAEKPIRDSIEKVEKVKIDAIVKSRLYLRSVLRDPKSYDEEGCVFSYKGYDTNSGVFNVRFTYRAKNGFGGYNICVTDVLGTHSNGEVKIIGAKDAE